MEAECSFVNVKPSMEGSGPPAGADDEDSFIILESPSSMVENSPSEVLPLFRTNKVREMQNLIKMEISQISSTGVPEMPSAVDPLDAVASPVAKITISPDSSYEEIQKQVEELIKENETLKNIIAQNNMSMKNQYERFVAYKDEVVNVMKTNRDKFNEAKICIDKSREENAKLVSDVEVYINIKKLHEEEIINLKEKIRKLETSSCVDLNPSLTNENDLKTELANANVKLSEVEFDNKKLVEEIEATKNKIDNLQTALTEAQQKINLLSEENKSLNEVVQSQLSLQHELSIKQQNIEKLTERLVSMPKLEEQIQTKQQEINVVQFEMSTLKDENTKLKIENVDLRQKLDNVLKESVKKDVQSTYEQQIKQRDVQITMLQNELQQIRLTEANQRTHISSLTTQLTDFQEKYNPTIKEDFKKLSHQLSLSQKTITALELEQDYRNQEIEKLKKLLQDSENDEIFALKQQLEVYKNDFEAEKKSKATIKQEKDQIAEDLQNVQTRNKQLQNEVETLRARNEPPKPEGYTCPKCSFAFSSYQSLENHVHRCLDLEDFP